MKTIQFMLLASIACHTTAFALDRAPGGSNLNPDSIRNADALFSRATGGDHTASSFDALPSWGWTLTGNLNVARELHTATLLQNGV